LPAPELPPKVRELALRLGAREGAAISAVRLAQRGTMWDRPGSREMAFSALQTINVHSPGFAWRARIGPLGCISIVDRLQDGAARIEVRLLGVLPIARIEGGTPLLKGEIIRCLAELAWAPDAILHDALLGWAVVDAQTFRVSAGSGPARGTVELHLDDCGRIAAVAAEDRPRKEGSGFVERPWRGKFFDYRQHCGRWLPFAGEVGWELEGDMFVAWRGRIIGWQVS
jgi:hypothetical protein